MIDLTPLEVRQKKDDFRRSFRGYDAELVNDFLDLVADRMEELVKENMALNDSVETLEQELTEYREKEAALSDALMAAQRLREDARKHAEKESELMIREAKAQAEEARQQAAKALAREEETLREVRARRAQLVESFRRLLEREIGELGIIEESLELTADAEKAEDRRVAGRTGRKDAGAPGQESAAGDGRAETGESGAGQPTAGEPGDEEVAADRMGPVTAPSSDEGAREEGDASDGEDGSAEDGQEDWLRSLAEE